MNKKKKSYDRLSVGDRIRSKRLALGLSQEEIAERINRATKYYSDIERGSCGMSIETMISIANSLDMSLDYMIFGTPTKEELQRIECQKSSLTHILAQCNSRQYGYITRLMQLFLASMTLDEDIQK